MFKGQQSISFTTSQSKQDAMNEVENALNVLGTPSIQDSGKITVNSNVQFNSFAHLSVIEGSYSQRENKVNITLNYESKLNTVGWILLVIGLCAYALGALVLILPYNAKKDLEKKIKAVLQEIKFQIGDV